MNILAFIPARSGSTGLCNKNLQKIRDKTLIELAIEAAQGVPEVVEIVLSTDYPSEVLPPSCVRYLHHRQPHLSTSSATAFNVLHSFLHTFESSTIDHILYLQPTSPLRNSSHIIDCINIMNSNSSLQGVISVCTVLPKYRKLLDVSSGLLKPVFDSKSFSSNRQSLNPLYMPNGAIYLFSISHFKQCTSFPCNGLAPYIMTHLESIDIDSEDDLNHARMVYPG